MRVGSPMEWGCEGQEWGWAACQVLRHFMLELTMLLYYIIIIVTTYWTVVKQIEYIQSFLVASCSVTIIKTKLKAAFADDHTFGTPNTFYNILFKTLHSVC